MKNPTLKIILFAAICLLVLWCVKECNTPKQKPTPLNTDSLEISEKQHGHEVAILLNEITEINKRLMNANNQIEVYKTREIALTDKNIALIKKLRQNAPKDCQPYIDSTNQYHLEIEAAKDSSYNALLDAKLIADTASMKKDTAIVELQGQVSDLHALRVADKEDLRKAERKVKRGKIATWCVGFGMGLLWLVTNIVN